MVKLAREYGVYPIDERLIEEYKKRNYIAKYLD